MIINLFTKIECKYVVHPPFTLISSVKNIFAEFVHTSDIESLNSLQLKYANKTDHFG